MRRTTRAIWLLLPLLVVTTSLTIASSEEMRVGIVTGLKGTAKVTRASVPQSRDLAFKDDVLLRDVIATGDGSMARILLGGKALLTVRERSVVKITETPNVSTVSVTAGRAAVNVMKERMRPGDSVEIVTPNATAAIRGTIVVAEVDPDEAGTRSTITVLRGLIDVTQHDPTGRSFGQPVSVSALQQVTAAGGHLSPVRTISKQSGDRMATDYKMGLRTPPAAPSVLQSEVDRAVQQVVVVKEIPKDTGKDSDSKGGDAKSDGKSGDSKSAGNGSGNGGNSGNVGGGTGNGGSSGGNDRGNDRVASGGSDRGGDRGDRGDRGGDRGGNGNGNKAGSKKR